MGYLKTLKKQGLIALLGFTLSYSAQAELLSAAGLGVGALVGATFSSNPTQFTFGVEAQHKLIPPIGLGVALTYFNSGTTLSGTNYSNSFYAVTGQALYHFQGQLDGLHAGVNLGAGISSTSIPGRDGSTDFIIGPMVGYDLPLVSQLTIGGEGTVFFTTQSNGNTIWQILAALKYWF